MSDTTRLAFRPAPALVAGILLSAVAALAALALSACATSPAAFPAASPAPGAPLPTARLEPAPGLVFEIDARLELLSGVQARTRWVEGDRGPREGGDAYYRALAARLDLPGAEDAVRRSEGLRRAGFAYDAPPAFALSLEGGEAFAPPAAGFGAYLNGRAIIPSRLDAFAASLAEAWRAAEFRAFFEERRPEYLRRLEEASAGFDWTRLATWLRDYYGSARELVCHYVLAPAMFPSGGYGFSREDSAGAAGPEGAVAPFHVYQIVRASGSPAGPEFPRGPGLALLGIHEFGHSFVNPALEAVPRDPRLDALFRPVADAMRRQAYGATPIFLNELVLRAASVRGAVELGLLDETAAEAALDSELERGFYPVFRVYELLADYEAARDRYPSFADYAPTLLARLAEESADLAAAYVAARPVAPEPVAAFREGFEAAPPPALPGAPPPGFAISTGAQTGSGAKSVLGVDPAEAYAGGRSFAFAADADTKRWLTLSKPLVPKRGELLLRFAAKGASIRKEPGQFGNSYVGLIVTEKSGKRRFEISPVAGDFDWEVRELRLAIDPARDAQVEFYAFLNESGRLWIDELEAAYR